LKKALLLFQNRVVVPTSRPNKMSKVRGWAVKEQLEAVHAAVVGTSGLTEMGQSIGKEPRALEGTGAWTPMLSLGC